MNSGKLMSFSELSTWRKRVPWFIFALCAFPWVWLKSRNLEETKLYSETIVPVVAVIAAYVYVGSDFRRTLWTKEIESHVGNQIRQALLEMVPRDLEVTEAEKQGLAQQKIIKELTGVFWEAVDRNENLRAHKDHFYSNGIVYSTSIDVFLICGFMSFVYATAAVIQMRSDLAYAGAFLIAIALTSRYFITPRKRMRHLELSAEQLEILRAEESEFVSNRFREIIWEWRRVKSF
jgi:hypothetical protein